MKRAFTLIELMIVVAIIGVLAAIAVPNFLKFQCKAKTSEARTNLKALYVAEESFLAESDTYTTIPVTGKVAGTVSNSIGFQPKGANIRYDYVATVGGTAAAPLFNSTASATVAALGTGAGAPDIWVGSDKNEVKQGTSNGCN
jgi:type IV pilus assembly protein PilA